MTLYTPESTVSDRRLSVLAWTTAAMLLGFLCLTHLGVLVSFLTTRAVLPLAVPVAFAGALVLGDWLGRREGLCGRSRLWPVGLTLGLTILAIVASAMFYDLSWDGQWYHQVGVYRIAEGWNPLTTPMQAFADHNQLWVRHYAKGPWYMGAAMMALSGQVEWGKFVTWLALDAAFLAVLAACLDAGISRWRAVAVGGLVALNPVVISELLSFLVDGLMVCYLACYAATLFSGIRRPNRLVIFVGLAAAICCINSKFTGLVFLCFILAGAGLYGLFRYRDLLWRFAGLNLMAITLGVVVFGYNPYVTNTIHRSHPFYPLAGSRAFPSLAQQGNDPIEQYETPPNMKGRHRLIRLGYAIFGRPGFPPYNDEPVARLMWPFAARPGDMAVYRFHDVRIAGLGPFFSGALVLSLILIGWLLWAPAMPRYLLLLSCGVLAVTVLINVHMWWARYSPQMWWFSLLPVVAVFWASRSRVQTAVAWGLVGILMINALIVATVRLHWEVASTRTLQRQLVELKASGSQIEVDFAYFGEPVGRRLKTWGIPYRAVRRDQIPDGQELISVAAGNPGGVTYQVKEGAEPAKPPQTPGTRE